MEIDRKVRKNGFSSPISYFQLIASCAFIFDIINFTIQILPYYIFNTKIIVSLIYSALYINFFYHYILLTYINPTDPLIQIYHNSQNDEFKDSLKKQFKIVCVICDSPVTNKKSKHCMKCNRCTLKFDHHCIFVNNCIGKLNYLVFIKLILSLEAIELMNIILMTYTFTSPSFLLSYQQISLILNFIRSLCFFAFITHLICFHIYLYFKKMTTIDFILRFRNTPVSPSTEIIETNGKVFEEINDESKIE